MWDPDVYLTFADHRGRPFADLLSRVGAPSPRRVVDLGCGAGNLTGQLARRWPEAAIEALDSSPEMVAAARLDGGRRRPSRRWTARRRWSPLPETAASTLLSAT